MTVGFIVVQAIGQPDDLIHSQLRAQHAFNLFTGQVRVTVAVQQAFAGGDQCAFTINVDRTAFQHKTFGVVARRALDFEDLAAHLLIAVPREVQPAVKPAPGVEVPVHAAHFAGVVDHERRPAVAHPGVIVGKLDHADVRHIELSASVFVLCGRHPDGHRLEAGNGLGHSSVRGLRRLAAQTPVVRALRPDHPDLSLRSPFGRHVKAVSAGRAVQSSHNRQDSREPKKGGWAHQSGWPETVDARLHFVKKGPLYSR